MSDMKPQPCPACGADAESCGDLYRCPDDDCDFIGVWPIELWNRLSLAPAASDETIPVRIAVVVDDEGHYGAAGWNGSDDLDIRNDAASVSEDWLCGPTRTTFVTALAYKPQPQPAMEVTGDSQTQ